MDDKMMLELVKKLGFVKYTDGTKHHAIYVLTPGSFYHFPAHLEDMKVENIEMPRLLEERFGEKKQPEQLGFALETKEEEPK